MSIYDLQILSERTIQHFKPTRLYIKKCGRWYYFGKTTNEDAQSYPGSGKVWKDVIKKYGKEQIKTLWVSDWYHDPHEIQEIALHFSRENQIVESSIWANCKPEDGLDGGATRFGMTGKRHTQESKNKISKANIGRIHSYDHKEKNRIANSGSNNAMFGKTHTKEARKKISLARVGRSSPMKGKKFTSEQRLRLSDVIKTLPKMRCIHCGKNSSPGNHYRWHDDNCKSKET